MPLSNLFVSELQDLLFYILLLLPLYQEISTRLHSSLPLSNTPMLGSVCSHETPSHRSLFHISTLRPEQIIRGSEIIACSQAAVYKPAPKFHYIP